MQRERLFDNSHNKRAEEPDHCCKEEDCIVGEVGSGVAEVVEVVVASSVDCSRV